MLQLLVEIRPGEGGQDAQSLVQDQARLYLRFAERNAVAAEIIDSGR